MNTSYKIAAAVTMALSAVNASAALIPTYDPTDPSFQTPINNGTGSSVLLAVNDQNSSSSNFGKTFLLDLGTSVSGLNFASFVNSTQGTNSVLSWNLANNSQFAALAPDLGKLSWSVVGGSVLDQTNLTNLGDIANGFPVTTAAPWGVIDTTSNPGAWNSNPQLLGYNHLIAQSEPGVGTIGGAILAANNSFSALGATGNVALAPASGNGSFNYTQALPFEGKIGTGSIGFYFVTNPTGLLGGTDTNIVTQLGSFSLNSNDVLTYTPAATTAPVPLPGAVWLFLSGLMGAIGFKKRQSAYRQSA